MDGQPPPHKETVGHSDSRATGCEPLIASITAAQLGAIAPRRFAPDRMDTILYGAAYYPEYLPEDRVAGAPASEILVTHAGTAPPLTDPYYLEALGAELHGQALIFAVG